MPACVFFRSFCRHFSYDNDKYLPDNMNNKAQGTEGERRGHITGPKRGVGWVVSVVRWIGVSVGGCRAEHGVVSQPASQPTYLSRS